ncbi:MAG: hypothetical protein NW237_11785 [Cyanobacteriota bacterium]|nr:hypothetical protein [Cyanobacteriota bacterium]
MKTVYRHLAVRLTIGVVLLVGSVSILPRDRVWGLVGLAGAVSAIAGAKPGRLLLQEGMDRTAQRNYAAALQSFNQVIEWDPKSTAGWLGRAHVQTLLKNYPAALRDLDMTEKLEPSLPAIFWARALIYQKTEDPQSALQEINRYLQRQPDAKGYSLRGGIHCQLGYQEAAQADFDLAIAQDQHYSQAYWERAQFFLQRGSFWEAIVDFTQVLNRDPRSLPALLGRAHAYAYQGDYPPAIADLTEVLRQMEQPHLTIYQGLILNPQHPSDKEASYYYRRGLFYYQQSDLLESIADMDQVIRRTPDYLMAYILRGNAHYDMGQVQQAFADYEGVFKLELVDWDPDDEFSCQALALARLRMGDREGALLDLEKAIRISGQHHNLPLQQKAEALLKTWRHGAHSDHSTCVEASNSDSYFVMSPIMTPLIGTEINSEIPFNIQPEVNRETEIETKTNIS